MIKLNRTVEYGLMAMRYISQKEVHQLSSAAEVAESLGISFDTTARVMQLLSQCKILKVEYGSGGGYQLNRPLTQISLVEFIEAIEGSMALVKCLNPESTCEISSKCSIVSPVQLINQRLTDFFTKLSLAEIFGVGQNLPQSCSTLSSKQFEEEVPNHLTPILRNETSRSVGVNNET